MIMAKKRIDLETKGSDTLELYAHALFLIEDFGVEDYVMEIRQVTCMGGIRYVVTHRDRLDEKYVGYRGYMDRSQLTAYIQRANTKVAK